MYIYRGGGNGHKKQQRALLYSGGVVKKKEGPPSISGVVFFYLMLFLRFWTIEGFNGLGGGGAVIHHPTGRGLGDLLHQ